ncbi:MAG: YwiC-like family protein [Chloroflexi bacterium]|nr:YwiC-like family protein [Chloroflexota bacterium]
MTDLAPPSYFRRHIALPADHGSWVFLFSPLLIGLFAGGRWTGASASALLVVAALAAFLARQPATILVKAYSGRRSRDELPAARFWLALYAGAGLAAGAGLLAAGFGYLLLLVIPGLAVFAWHLYLVSRRAERKQLGVELVASGVLALAAPAALWVGRGNPAPVGWWLWALCWMQSAASIVHAYLRLEQRTWSAIPGVNRRAALAGRALLYTTFNLVATAALCFAAVLPPLIFAPFALQWAETVLGAFVPAIGARPTAIGVRQLIVSTAFTVLFILFWR